jgi:3-deoxy-7-phosphoheptulonate synthase
MKKLELTTLENNHNQYSIINADGILIGKDFTIIAGPCSVETFEQTLEVAHVVKESGAHLLRGGAFKPRTSPYEFQGLGEEGLRILKAVKEETGLPVISEVMDPRHVEFFLEYVDVLQVGSRNMKNYMLLKEVGKTSKPVLLKRGMDSTLNEWLNSAEYILCEGNPNVFLCERGIRTFETCTRNTLDLNIVPCVKKMSHLPIIVDPSHGTGRADIIESMSLAAVAAGADGIMVEVHPDPGHALSDPRQQINLEAFRRLVEKINRIRVAMTGGETSK